ncbi:hypothetical protein Mal65_22740 [Crateriforma conspicua]|nr:hypothetical protein Mal65_22740 [Crateriforma conspicua]
MTREFFSGMTECRAVGIRVILVFAVSVVFCIGNSRTVHGAETRSPIPVVLRETQPNLFEAKVNLDGIEINSNRSVVLKLSNPDGNSPITLSKPVASCGCLQVAVSDTRLPAGGEIEIVLKVAVDRNQKAPIWRQTVSFDSKKPGDSIVKLEIVSRVNGLLRFEDDRFLVQLYEHSVDDSDPKLLERRFAFYATEPIQNDKLQLIQDQSDPAVSVSIDPLDTERGELVLRIDEAHMGDEGVKLSYQLRDPESEQTASLSGVVVRRSALSIVPSILRIVRNEDGKLDAHVIVLNHAADRQSHDKGDPKEASPIAIEASLAGRKLRTRVTQAGKGFARVGIRIPEELISQFNESSTPQMSIQVDWGDRRMATKRTLLPVSTFQSVLAE